MFDLERQSYELLRIVVNLLLINVMGIRILGHLRLIILKLNGHQKPLQKRGVFRKALRVGLMSNLI